MEINMEIANLAALTALLQISSVSSVARSKSRQIFRLRRSARGRGMAVWSSFAALSNTLLNVPTSFQTLLLNWLSLWSATDDPRNRFIMAAEWKFTFWGSFTTGSWKRRVLCCNASWRQKALALTSAVIAREYHQITVERPHVELRVQRVD